MCGGGEEGGGPPPDTETFLHLFETCPFVKRTKELFLAKWLPEINAIDANDKKLFWFCGFLTLDKYSRVLHLVSMFINFYIWERKLGRQRISLASMELSVDYNMRRCLRLSRKMRHGCQSINMLLFRNWSQQEGGEEDKEENNGE
jgi:hypothetical protein